ncbi:hypothetical protein GCM10010390_16070 [Streptomyces mordarskii]|uniref:Uncharacterized protein n=1 Tax=Streptomyces mordarskii TaxID=1226758 RepID=A0ABP3M9P1_9ACTN
MNSAPIAAVFTDPPRQREMIFPLSQAGGAGYRGKTPCGGATLSHPWPLTTPSPRGRTLRSLVTGSPFPWPGCWRSPREGIHCSSSTGSPRSKARPEDPAEGPRVRVLCATDGLRNDDSHEGTFPARCLGKVRDWNPGTGELTIEAIAIFS